MTIGESGRTCCGHTLTIETGGVENVPVTGSVRVAPESALSPAGTVIVTSVAFGNRASVETNAATRVSIHFHAPLIAGVIVIGSGACVPTAATGTIGSSNRIRIAASAATSPIGRIIGGVSGFATAAPGAIGASETGLPVGTTNAIGCTAPARGGGSEAGRRVGAFAFCARRSGSGSSRARRAEVSAAESVDTAAVDPAIRWSGVVAIRLPIAEAVSIATRGRPVGGGSAGRGAAGVVTIGAGRAGAGREGAGQAGSSMVQAVHRQTNARPRFRRIDHADTGWV